VANFYALHIANVFDLASILEESARRDQLRFEKIRNCQKLEATANAVTGIGFVVV